MRPITCPSGMQLEVRAIKGKEVQLFQDRAAQKNGTLIDKILTACTVAVVDPGPYEFKGDSPEWDKVLTGDKFYTFVQIRIETYGAEYDFTVQCEDCHTSIPWNIDLDTLPVKPLSEEDAESFKTGAPMVATAPDGRSVTFRLTTGQDERSAVKAKNDQNAQIKLTALRIFDLDGVKERAKIQAALEEMTLPELTGLIQEFDKRDCGIETKVDVECPECGATRGVTLPLGRTFLFPRS